MPDVGHRPLASQQSFVFLRFHHILDFHAWGGFFDFGKSVSASLFCLMLPFYPLLWRLRSFSEVIIPFVVVNSLCPWKEMGSGSS